MKMLEICLKLVGCKSKKGLSSSSSCYLEGEWDGRPLQGHGEALLGMWGGPSGARGHFLGIRRGFLGSCEPTAVPGAAGLCVHDFGTR